MIHYKIVYRALAWGNKALCATIQIIQPQFKNKQTPVYLCIPITWTILRVDLNIKIYFNEIVKR